MTPRLDEERFIFPPNFNQLLQARFSALSTLTAEEADFLNRLASRVRENQGPETAFPNLARGPFVLATGWAGLIHQRRNGARQIVEIYLPGDLIGWGMQPFKGLFPAALTKTSTIAVPDMGASGTDRQRGFFAHLRAATIERQFLHTNHIVRLGRASAYGRVANLLAEIHWRLQQRGLATASTFTLQLTQEHMADALGLSAVHINRILQQLRREKLIRHEPGRVIYVDGPGLAEAGEFRQPAI